MWLKLLFLLAPSLADYTFNLTNVCFEVSIKNAVNKHAKYCETVTTDNLADVLPKGAKKIEIIDQNLNEIYENSFGHIVGSKELHIINCGVHNLEPGAFNNSESFQIVNLQHNVIKELKKDTFNIRNLIYLHLSYNEIKKIEAGSFENLPHLIEVDLSYNKLANVDATWFLNLPALELLHFENNSIEQLPDHFFEKFNDGISIFLSYNKIKSVEMEVFHGMENKQLKKFYIDHNDISFWSEDLSSNILDLKIDNNKISCPEGIFKNIIKNSSIQNFEHNPYDCVCLKDMKTWTDQHGRHSEWFRDIYFKCREEGKVYRRRPIGIFRGVGAYIRN